MKAILLMMVMSLPVLGQKRVWEIDLPVAPSSVYNNVVAITDADGNAAVLNFEYDVANPGPERPVKTTLFMVTNKGKSINYNLPLTHNWWRIASFQKGSVTMQAKTLQERSLNAAIAPIYLVKQSGNALVGKWIEAQTLTEEGLIENQILNAPATAQSVFHGWIEIKANKDEAKQLRKQLAAKERANLKACKAERATIRKAAAKIIKLESEQSNFAAKVNKRLAILEGRNNA